MDSVDSLRSKMFWNKLRRYGKFYDLSLLPPCASTLRKHTARSNYICHIWKNAINQLQNLESFENYGWLADGNIEWIDKPYPDDVKQLLTNQEDSLKTVDDSEDKVSDSEEDDGDDLTDVEEN